MKRHALLGLLFLLVGSTSAIADPAVALSPRVNICFVAQVCPPEMPDSHTAVSGQQLPFGVIAVDANGLRATGYVGTVVFTSTDPEASLPPSYTFTAADDGFHAFPTTVLRTLGQQTIFATDSANGLAGSDTLTVVNGNSAAAVPATTSLGRLAFVFLLAGIGTWLASRA